MIRIEHLKKQYERVTPLKDINLTVNKGDVISLIGPSGCGKSTLLRCVNMLETPTEGKIIIDEDDITQPKYNLNKLRLKVGMIFQRFYLFQHQTVIENIMKPQMKLLGRSKQEAYDRALALLSSVGLAEFQFQFPDKLSGGQQQRVAIARALAMDPDILLLDEPTSALDPAMVSEVESVIHDLAKKGTTMMVVTHDMNLARNVSTRICYLDEGIVYEEGTPEQIFTNPQREKTRRFIRNMYSMSIKIEPGLFDYGKAVADIERFGNRQGIDGRIRYKIQMAFEEICVIHLPQKAGNDFSALVTFENIDKENMVTMSVKHNAGTISKDKLKSDLSLVITSMIASEFKQIELNEEDSKYTNEIVLKFIKGEEDANEK